MIRIAITPAAYDAICSWPVQRQGGNCLIHIEAAVVDRLQAMRGPGEDYHLAAHRVGAGTPGLAAPGPPLERQHLGAARRRLFALHADDPHKLVNLIDLEAAE